MEKQWNIREELGKKKTMRNTWERKTNNGEKHDYLIFFSNIFNSLFSCIFPFLSLDSRPVESRPVNMVWFTILSICSKQMIGIRPPPVKKITHFGEGEFPQMVIAGICFEQVPVMHKAHHLKWPIVERKEERMNIVN